MVVRTIVVVALSERFAEFEPQYLIRQSILARTQRKRSHSMPAMNMPSKIKSTGKRNRKKAFGQRKFEFISMTLMPFQSFA